MRTGLRHVVRFGVSLAVLVLVSFLMVQLVPGDPVRAALGATAPQDLVTARRAELGLDQPMLGQLTDYVSGLVQGDFGTSFLTRQPVVDVIGDRLPATVQLALLALAVALVIAIPLGLWIGVRTRHGRARTLELTFTSTTGAVAAVPDFLLAVGLVVVFAMGLGWFPPAGRAGLGSYVLPVAALAAGPAAVLSRLVRVETLRELELDYVRLARAKRLRPSRIHLRHVLPNALTASLTVGGLLLAAMMAGTVIVEYVFAWPGLGTRFVESIIQKDFPVARAMVLVYGTAVLLVNLLVDLVLVGLDPRSTLEEA